MKNKMPDMDNMQTWQRLCIQCSLLYRHLQILQDSLTMQPKQEEPQTACL